MTTIDTTVPSEREQGLFDGFTEMNDGRKRLTGSCARNSCEDGRVPGESRRPGEICTLLTSRHGLGSSRQAISQHLAVLEDAGLVAAERRGRSKFHYFNSEPLAVITQRWLIARKDAT